MNQTLFKRVQSNKTLDGFTIGATASTRPDFADVPTYPGTTLQTTTNRRGDPESDALRKDSVGGNKLQHSNSSNNFNRENSSIKKDEHSELNNYMSMKQIDTHRLAARSQSGLTIQGAIRSTTSLGIRTNAFEVKQYPSKVVKITQALQNSTQAVKVPMPNLR